MPSKREKITSSNSHSDFPLFSTVSFFILICRSRRGKTTTAKCCHALGFFLLCLSNSDSFDRILIQKRRRIWVPSLNLPNAHDSSSSVQKVLIAKNKEKAFIRNGGGIFLGEAAQGCLIQCDLVSSVL